MQNHHNKTALLVMDMQNGIVSRFAEDVKVLLPFQRMPLHTVNILRTIKRGVEN